MDATYKYRPYEGIATLRDGTLDLRGSLDEACAQAERALGCAPKGRLHTLVYLSSAAALLQQVRDDDGTPLFLVKGGLVWQSVLSEHARPTRDLDGIITCGFNEFLELVSEALAPPWGDVHARIGGVRMHPGEDAPYDTFEFELTLAAEGCEPLTVSCNGSVEKRSDLVKPHAYPALALDALELPAPDALWGASPARCVCDKLLALAEPCVSADDVARGVHARPHKSAKHLVDALYIARMCERGDLCDIDDLRPALAAFWEYENDLRMRRGFAVLERPLCARPHEGWELEYLYAAIQCGLETPYDQAQAEVDAFMARVDRAGV